MSKKLAIAWLTMVLLTLAGCKRGPSSGNTPREMFEHVIQQPIPAGVRNLEGVGDTWQGYSLYLRFNASDEDINALIAAGFQRVEWSSIAWRFAIPAGYDRFEPSWNPSTIQVKECYEADVSNSWTYSGSHYLVIDRKTGTVYFYGVGG